jgi:renal tumor antigen
LLSKRGEGAFSQVLRAKSVETGQIVAIKCMKTLYTSQSQVDCLPELQALRKVSACPSVISLLDVI